MAAHQAPPSLDSPGKTSGGSADGVGVGSGLGIPLVLIFTPRRTRAGPALCSCALSSLLLPGSIFACLPWRGKLGPGHTLR